MLWSERLCHKSDHEISFADFIFFRFPINLRKGNSRAFNKRGKMAQSAEMESVLFLRGFFFASRLYDVLFWYVLINFRPGSGECMKRGSPKGEKMHTYCSHQYQFLVISPRWFLSTSGSEDSTSKEKILPAERNIWTELGNLNQLFANYL